MGKHVLLSAVVDPNLGFELYLTDGTRAGTRILGDIELGSGSSRPGSAALVRGRVLFSAEASAFGREVYEWKTDLATTQNFGEGCGPDWPTLSTTTPQLGSTMTLSGRGIGNRAGLLFVGPARTSTAAFGCPDHVGLLNAILIGAVASPNFSAQLSIPTTPSLAGVQVTMQGWFLAAQNIFPLQSTNGVFLQLGK